MHKKLIARTAKLLSESKKSRRHQGIAIAYEHIPHDLDERNHGSIYALVNVNAPAASAEEVAELIVDAFFGEYYQDLSRHPLSSFEAALARVNEELAEITHNGNIYWLNNLNAVLAVLVDDTIHMTQTGKAEAFLYRSGKSSHITKDLAGDSINPLRTFINVASGELLEGDKVAIVTPGVFFHVSKDELQKYVEEFQPKIAISHLADLLEGNSTEMQPNSILIIEAITPEAASEETITEINDEVWLSEPNKPIETVLEKSAPFAKKAIFKLGEAWGALSGFFVNKAWPWTQDTALDIYDSITDLAKRGREAMESAPITKVKQTPKIPKESIEVSEDKTNLDDITINEHSNNFVEDTTKGSGNVIHIKETSNKPKWVKLEKINLTYPSHIKNRLVNTFKAKGKDNKKNLLITASIVLIILIGGVFGIWQIHQSNEKQKLAETSYTEAQNKLNSGKSEAANGNKSEAAKTLNGALSITKTLENNKKLSDKVIALEGQINSALDNVLAITKITPTKLADLTSISGKSSFGPFIINDNIYLVSKDNGNISATSLNGESSNVLDAPNINGKVIAATGVTVRSTIVLFTDKGYIYEFDTKDVTLTKQATSGNMETPIAMASFSTNIYTLDASGQIFKRTKTSTGYSQRNVYTASTNESKDAVAMAIDSNVYITKSNGTVIKYLGGDKQDYNLSDLPVTLSSISSIFTNEDTSGLYLTSKDSIIRADENGKYLGQYSSNILKGISGIYADDQTKTMYAFVNGILYKFNQ